MVIFFCAQNNLWPVRREIDPNMGVEVEVPDVNEDEACALLLSIDPLAALAHTQQEIQFNEG